MENEGYETIDLLEVLNAVRQHLLAVILTTVILAGVGFGVSKFLITPQYEASALMIVNTRQDTTSNVTSDQINSVMPRKVRIFFILSPTVIISHRLCQ